MQSKIDYPDSDEIDPDTARFLFENLAVVIVENMPPGTEFCFDLNEVQVGHKFKGIKIIPPGVHYICSSACDKHHGHIGVRSGFMHHFKPREVLVVRWSEQSEDFDDNFKIDNEQLERYTHNLKNLDPFLGPYKFSTYRRFLALTDMITAAHIEKLTPVCGRIRSATQLVPDVDGESKSRAPGQPKPMITGLKSDPATSIRFTPIPNEYYPDGATSSDITRHYLDSSFQLEKILSQMSNYKWLLGELQFAFIILLIGQIYDSFEHWKSLLRLICNADAAINRHPELFVDFIKLLRHQIEEVPEDFFVDIVDSNNFLFIHLKTLFSNLSSLPDNDASVRTDELRERGKQFRSLLSQKFGWDFDFEPDDEQPVVVDIVNH